MVAQKRANGRFSPKVSLSITSRVLSYMLTQDCVAIDHIKTTQQNEMRLQHELNQLRRDSEFTRDTAKENELLKTEIQIMQQHLRRLEPNNAHVYGTYSHSITNQGPAAHPPQTNGTSGISLPPLNPSGSSNGQHANQHSGFGGSAPAAAMQGVEYNGYNAR